VRAESEAWPWLPLRLGQSLPTHHELRGLAGLFGDRGVLVTIHLLLFSSLPSCFWFFRYYFKKVSDEFDCGVVFEEVREDDTILPIFEEKIVGKVEKID